MPNTTAKNLPKWVGESDTYNNLTVEQFLNRFLSPEKFHLKPVPVRRKIIFLHYQDIRKYGYTSIPPGQNVLGRYVFLKPNYN